MHTPSALHASLTHLNAFDINGEGENELVSGWQWYQIETRKAKNGTLVCRDYFKSPISAVMTADYRMLGTEELIAYAENGEV